jgi:hypothetical protein
MVVFSAGSTDLTLIACSEVLSSIDGYDQMNVEVHAVDSHIGLSDCMAAFQERSSPAILLMPGQSGEWIL